MFAPSGTPAPTARLACVATEHPELLLPACRRLTPRIERHRQMLVLDLTGCDQLLAVLTHATHPQADAQWLALAHQLSRFLRAEAPLCRWRIGLAPTRTLAWLAALHASTSPHPCWQAVTPADAHAFLHPLPLAALLALPELAERPESVEALTALAEAGVTMVGHLVRLSIGALHRRFGTLGQLLLALATGQDDAPRVPPLTLRDEVDWDLVAQGLSVRPHPLTFRRRELDGVGVVPIATLAGRRAGERALVAGLVISAQRPPTAKGTAFITLEDETGRVEAVVQPHLAESIRRLLVESRLLAISGRIERSGEHVTLLARTLRVVPAVIPPVSHDDGRAARRVAKGEERRADR